MDVISGLTAGVVNYRDMKNKYKIQRDDNMYYNYICDIVSQMFVFDERIYRPELFDRMLRDLSMCALIKTDTSDYTPVVFCPVDNGNGRYADGWFKDCVCFDFRGMQYRFSDWENNPEILVFFNTPLRNPDLFQDKYASALSDIDMSIMNNVHFSRMHPIPTARDKQTKNRIDAAMKAISDGKWETVLMENSIAEIADGVDSINLLNITDVEKSQYIQYLSHLHDKFIGRLFFMIGLGASEAEKRAQISIPELEKNDDASIGMVLAWYKARKGGFDVAREKGHDLFFDFSDVWKRRYDSIVNPPEETTPEEEEKEEDTEEEEVEEDADSGNDSDE